jgi:hypothetical protein
MLLCWGPYITHFTVRITKFLDFFHRPAFWRLENWICFRPQVRGKTLSWVQWSRLALSKGPSWVSVFSPRLRKETDPVSETLCFYSLEYRTMEKLKTPVILSVTHHRQNPLGQCFSTFFIRRGPGIIDVRARYQAMDRRLRNTALESHFTVFGGWSWSSLEVQLHENWVQARSSFVSTVFQKPRIWSLNCKRKAE